MQFAREKHAASMRHIHLSCGKLPALPYWLAASNVWSMAHSHSLTPEKSTDIHAGVDVKKKTTRVNLVIVLAVLTFFALGTLLVLKVANNPPQTPADNPIKP